MKNWRRLVSPLMEGAWRPRTEPRGWQAEALGCWVNAGRRGVASVVTGAGKTVFGMMCMEQVRQNDPNAAVVVVVPTLALLDQWFVSLVDDFALRQDEIGLYSGETICASHRDVSLMVLNTARAWAPRLASRRPSMLIVDECHRSASPENAKALAGDHIATLGLSATPQRDYDDLFAEVIIPALGPIVYEYDYNRARSDGVISPFELVNIEIPLTAPERERYDALTKRLARLMRQYRDGMDVEDRLKKVLRDRAAVSASASFRIPVAVKLALEHSSERILIFHEQIKASHEIAQLLNARGRRVAEYHSRLGAAIRRDNLRMFRRGQLDVLVTCRALDEGVNVPEASVAIVASSTASTRQRIQRLGRVLRPAPGKTGALVHTLYATAQEETRLRKEAERLDGAEGIEWRKVLLPDA